MNSISDHQDTGGEPEVALHERAHEVLLASSVVALDEADGLSAEKSLAAIESAHALGARLELVRLRAVQQLALRTGQEILAQRGFSDESEMSEHARKQWRAACKRVAATEVHVLTGMGKGRARQLVAIALAPQPVAIPVHQALGAGIARFEHVEMFWVRCRRLPYELAAQVSLALFATTGVEPDQVAVERLDPDGRIGHEPWRAKEFAEALEREATRAEGQDPEAAAKKREQIHQDRTAYGIVDDDGSGQVVITGDGISTTACVDRLQDLAHRARAAGDERTEAQLRSDIARALLQYGILPLPDPDPSLAPNPAPSTEPSTEPGSGPDDRGDASLFAPADLEYLSRVLSGAPSVQMQVIVPWDVLTGQAVMANQTNDPLDGKTRSGTKTATETQAEPGAAPESQAPPEAGHDGRWVEKGHRVEEGRWVEGVGRVVGTTPRFLTGEAARALALAPGTTLYRLLVDPADGRCLERSVERYRPDAAMRVQVQSADVLSRAPGSTVPVKNGQLDHVLPWADGGATAETNLQGLDVPWHSLKTDGFWQAAMDATRNVTWTSFWGRTYRTRPHDYRQYLSTGLPPTPDLRTDHAGVAPHGEQLDLATQRHLASLLVYSALTRRQSRSYLEAVDDDPDSDVDLSDSYRYIWVRHTRERDGRKVSGARQGTPSPEDILRTPADAILRAEHWTAPFKQRSRGRGRSASANDDQHPPF